MSLLLVDKLCIVDTTVCITQSHLGSIVAFLFNSVCPPGHLKLINAV